MVGRPLQEQERIFFMQKAIARSMRAIHQEALAADHS